MTVRGGAGTADGRRRSTGQAFGGCWIGDFVLYPIGGSVVNTVVCRIEAECFNEFCTVRADRYEIDRIEPYAAGGLTDHGRSERAGGLC